MYRLTNHPRVYRFESQKTYIDDEEGMLFLRV